MGNDGYFFIDKYIKGKKLMIKENQRILNTIFVIIDAVIIAVSLISAYYIRFNSSLFTVNGDYLRFYFYMKSLLFIIPLYLSIYYLLDLYTSYRVKTIYVEIKRIIKGNLIGILLLLTALFLLKYIDYSRLVLVIFFVNVIVLTSVERICVRALLHTMRRKGYNLKHIVIVGTGKSAAEFIEKVNRLKYLGYNITGIFADKDKRGTEFCGFPVIDKIEKLGEYLDIKRIDEVVIALLPEQNEKLSGIINICEKHGIRSMIIPDFNKYTSAYPYIDEIDGLQLIKIRHVPLDNILKRYIKRLTDIIGSLLAIIIFSPVMFITTVLVKLTSAGPIIFRQKRVGEGGKEFEMYKFRSMIPHSEEVAATKWTEENDPRRTKFGSFIRKLSIDELPQLFNVLKGEMSLVGPRPERPYFVKKFKEKIPKYMVKHQVSPGITGWAQVNGWRGDTSIKKRIEYDIYYVENWTFIFDIKILFMTLYKGFTDENAY